MKDTARLIITFDCNRDCLDCCNKTDPSVKTAEHINDLSALKEYPYICITGGEPLLYPKKLLVIINKLRKQNSKLIIYLYTTIYSDTLYDIVSLLDGVHYSLHYPCKADDIADFEFFQDLIEECNYQTFRLYIDSRISNTITIQPNLWHRVEIKPWMKECSLPDNEKLFILEKNYE